MEHRVWLITGCSSGFGETFVRQILARGDRVIATGRKLEKLRHLEPLGATILQLDVTDTQENLKKIISEAIGIHGSIDVLVNNAAYITTGAWEDLEYEQFLAEFDTNVFGVIKVTRAVLPHFRERRSGTMVFLSSRSGWYGDPFVSAYSGSKFALEGLVEGLSRETAALGIRTLLIAPGRFRTNFLTPGNLQIVQSKIPDYAEGSAALIQGLAQEDRTQPGDVEIGVKIIIDLVRKEGVAAGRDIPFRLPLGSDCYDTIKEKCEQTLKLLDDWKDVIKSTDYVE